MQLLHFSFLGFFERSRDSECVERNADLCSHWDHPNPPEGTKSITPAPRLRRLQSLDTTCISSRVVLFTGSQGIIIIMASTLTVSD